MAGQDDGRRRTFTVREANAALPLVRAIVADLVRLAAEVSDRSERLSALLAGRPPLDGNDPYTEELAQVTADLERDRERLREYADELLELGVEPQSAVEGLVSFPALMDGRAICLCWKLGEPEVLFWHEFDAEYDDRRPLLVDHPNGDEAVLAGRVV